MTTDHWDITSPIQLDSSTTNILDSVASLYTSIEKKMHSYKSLLQGDFNENINILRKKFKEIKSKGNIPDINIIHSHLLESLYRTILWHKEYPKKWINVTKVFIYPHKAFSLTKDESNKFILLLGKLKDHPINFTSSIAIEVEDIKIVYLFRINKEWHMILKFKALPPQGIHPSLKIVGIDLGSMGYTLHTGETVTRKINWGAETLPFLSFIDKETRRLSKEYSVICVEDVGLSRKLKFWKQFIEVLEARMFSTGGILIKNPPQYSSRKCYICGYINIPKECSEREFVCVSCGMICNRDVNASRNNLEGGLSQNAPFFLKQLRKECYGTKDRGAGPALISSLHKIKNPEGLDEVFGDYTRAMNVILSCEYKLKLSTTALWQRIPLLRKQFSCFKNIHTQSIRAFITRSDIREYFIRGITPGVSLICYPKGSFNADTFKIKFGKINKTFDLSSSYIKHSEPEECWLIKDTEGVWWVDIRDKPIITEIKKEGILAGMSMFPYQIVFSDGFVLPSFFKFMQDTEVYDPYQKTYCTLKDKLLFRYMYMNSSINIILDRGYSTIFVESNIYWQELNGGRHFISCLTAEGTEKGIQVIRVPSSTVRGRCHCCNTKTTVFIKQFLKEITDEKKFLYCPVCGIKTNWQKNLVLTILKKGASSLGG